jgi:hypothetical protein
MSWFSKFLTPAEPKAPVVPPRPAPPRPPAPNPPVVPWRSPAAPTPSFYAPVRPAPGVIPGGFAGVPAVKPPWFPNEGPALEGAANAARRALSEIDAVVADLQHSVAAVQWIGPDAEQFRLHWRNEQGLIEETRTTLRSLESSLRQHAFEEATRFRMQESS